MIESRLRVLFVPDSTYWVTGTIAKSIARFNPWIEATIASGPVIAEIFESHPELMRNFDLVHFTCPFASREWLPRFRERVPCVTSHHHASDWELIKHNADGDAIIVGSAEWAEDLRARGVDVAKVFCVPYGVDAERFSPSNEAGRAAARKRLGIATGAIVVGFFGKNNSNEYDRKGIDVFTEAAVRLARRLPAATILIVGPGWKALVEALNSSGVACVWVPFVRDYADMPGMYHALDFYWVTARIEGGPVTLLEAMASEVCCLTTSVGLAREIVRDGQNAVLLPFNSPETVASRTAVLAADNAERRRLGRNARATILDEMDVGVTARRVRFAYARAAENFSARAQRPAPRDVRDLPEDSTPVEPSNEMTNEVPLSGFPPALQRRAGALETLIWCEHLILYHGQRGLAVRMIAKEWLRNPLSLLPARVLARRFLPPSIVASVVKWRRRLVARDQ